MLRFALVALFASLLTILPGRTIGAQDFPSQAEIDAQAVNVPEAMRQSKVVHSTLAQSDAPRVQPTVATPVLPAPKLVGPIKLLGQSVAPGTKMRLNWTAGDAFGTGEQGAPVTVINGRQAGIALCLTGGIHGDELNGIEVVNRIASKLDPKLLRGVVIAVPVVNVSGFQRSSRYLPDRRDLNRYFPGNPNGSSAARVAHHFFQSVVVGCDLLVDFHTGSFERSNLPQVRGDLRLREVMDFARNFGATTVLHSPGSRGMLRVAATDAGIPAVTFELGAPIRLDQKEIDFGVRAIETLMSKLEMSNRLRVWNEPQPVLYRSQWLRTDVGGLLIGSVELGVRVIPGQVLGVVRNPLTGDEAKIVSNARGKIIGLALNQQVMPGYAVFHIGVESTERDVRVSALKPRLLPREIVEEEEEDGVAAAPDTTREDG